MKNKKLVLILFVLLIVVVGSASAVYKKISDNIGISNESVNDTKQIKAPDFTVFDGDMNKVSLYDFKDKPVVVNFWATWCGPCKVEMPYFEEAYKMYKDEIEFLMVNLTDGQRDTVEGVKEFIKKEGYSFPVLYDTEYDAANTYGTYSIPVTVFIGSDGMVKNVHTGSLRRELLMKNIENIMDK